MLLQVVDRLRVLLTAEEKDAFSAAWRAAKATAPSKPHRNGPARTPWAHVLHPIVAGMDVVADNVMCTVAHVKGRLGSMLGTPGAQGGGGGSGGVYGAGATRGTPEPHGMRVA